MICYSLDRSLLNFARKNKLRYTRYADDLVFSSHAKRSLYKVVRYAPDKTSPEITKHIASIIKKNGFEVNEQKIGIFGKGTRQIVTGIVVNKKCNFRRSDYRFLRNAFYYWKKKGKYEAAQRYFQAKGKWQIIVEKSNNDKNYIEGYFQFHLQGMLHYFSMIEKGSGRVSAPLCKLWDHFHDLTGEPVPEMSFERSVLMSDSYIRYHCIGEDKEQEYGCKGTAFILKGIGIVSALHCFSPITVSGITIDKSYILLDTNDKTIELCSDSISAKSYADDWVLFSTIPKELSGLPGLIAAPKRVLPQKGQRVTAYGYAEGDKVIRRIDAKVLEVLNNVVIVDRAFIKGMSGGPVLNSRGEVIGLITKGSGEGSYNYDGQFVLLNAIPQVEKKIENTIITD